jgi:hypothetical protein
VNDYVFRSEENFGYSGLTSPYESVEPSWFRDLFWKIAPLLKPPQSIVDAVSQWCRSLAPGAIWTIESVVDSGLSAGRVWKISVGSSEEPINFALKAWGLSSEHQSRIESILHFQSLLQKNNLAKIVPAVMEWQPGRRVQLADGDLWTITSWLPGKPLAMDELPASDGLMQQAVDVLAELHIAGLEFTGKVGESPGMAKRIDKLSHWAFEEPEGAFKKWLQCKKAVSIDFDASRVWQELEQPIARGLKFKVLIPMLLQSITAKDKHHHLLCVQLVGDLWRQNILVHDGCISGIIDFGASRVDWPMLEVVRWLSSWAAFDDARLESLLNEYDKRIETSLLSRETSFLRHTQNKIDIGEFRQLDRLCTWAAFLQWLDWLREERFDLATLKSHVLPRIKELVTRLECVHC